MKFSIAPLLLLAIANIAPLIETKSFPRVRIFNPKEGDIWFTGETRQLVWRKASIPPPPDPPTLNITLRRENHNLVLPIVRNWDTNKGSLKWKIPEWLPNGDDYRIYILPNRAFPREGTPNIMASKSKSFTIVRSNGNNGDIAVRSPVKSDVWYGGQFRFIRWSFPTDRPASKVSIFVEDVENGYVGVPYPYEIASDLPAKGSDGVTGYRWQVPYSFRTSSGYQIRIVAEFDDGSSEPVTGLSPQFKIIQIGDASNGGATPGPVLP